MTPNDKCPESDDARVTPETLSAITPLARPRGGRPRKRDTLVVNVRLSIACYDSYIREAQRLESELGVKIPIRKLLRGVLERQKPKM